MQLSILTEGGISTVQDAMQAHFAGSVANQKKV